MFFVRRINDIIFLLQMLESDNPEFPKTLQDEAINECLGYGKLFTKSNFCFLFSMCSILKRGEKVKTFIYSSFCLIQNDHLIDCILI